MTFVGQVLVVLQVVMSVCFMMLAGAVFTVQENWRNTATQLQADLKETQSTLANKETEFEQFKTELTADLQRETDRADGLQAKNTGLEQQLAAKTTELVTTKTESDEQRALAQIAGEEAKVRRDEALKQRELNDHLHKSMNDLIAKVRSLEDDLFGKQITMNAMVEKQNRLLAEYQVLQKVVRANGLDTDPKAYLARQAPPPLVVGLVEETKENKGNGSVFVSISLGSDDGLVSGHEMYVYRYSDLKDNQRAKYLGKIEIVHVTPDKAVGRVVERAKNGIIEVGDNVSTRL